MAHGFFEDDCFGFEFFKRDFSSSARRPDVRFDLLLGDVEFGGFGREYVIVRFFFLAFGSFPVLGRRPMLRLFPRIGA